ncbi:MAG TPA: IPT/TIG domain-containing protein, partial [Planctomycetota bacterium]|nr:IPT/TIG domain-containing protein [Planctomycetota bacterium]
GISEPFGLRSFNGFVSDYARTNHREDFAETCKFYWLSPDELARVSPAKFAYMRDRVFGGLSSPASARVGFGAIAPVRPAIASLGDSHDSWYSEVTVHGQYFMGPFDGGFNRVRIRGTVATHVPVSEQTIYSWVPAISKGSAPLTVQTQDGTSDPAAFRVDEPWWKFW